MLNSKNAILTIAGGMLFHAFFTHLTINAMSSCAKLPPFINFEAPLFILSIYLVLIQSSNNLLRHTSNGWGTEVRPSGIMAMFVLILNWITSSGSRLGLWTASHLFARKNNVHSQLIYFSELASGCLRTCWWEGPMLIHNWIISPDLRLDVSVPVGEKDQC